MRTSGQPDGLKDGATCCTWQSMGFSWMSLGRLKMFTFSSCIWKENSWKPVFSFWKQFCKVWNSCLQNSWSMFFFLRKFYFRGFWVWNRAQNLSAMRVVQVWFILLGIYGYDSIHEYWSKKALWFYFLDIQQVWFIVPASPRRPAPVIMRETEKWPPTVESSAPFLSDRSDRRWAACSSTSFIQNAWCFRHKSY